MIVRVAKQGHGMLQHADKTAHDTPKADALTAITAHCLKVRCDHAGIL